MKSNCQLQKVLCLSLFVCVSLFLASCGDDSNSNPEKDVKSASTKASLVISQDLLDIADLTITYIDETGVSKTEPLNATTWNKTITQSKFPAKFSFQLSGTVKTNFDPNSKTSYEITRNLNIVPSFDGKPLKSISDYSTLPVPCDKILTWLNNRGPSLIKASCTINSDGTLE